MTRFLYDVRTPRQRGLVTDERTAMHRAELLRAQSDRRRADPTPRRWRWWPRFAYATRQAEELGTKVAELQYRLEHLERRLKALSPHSPT